MGGLSNINPVTILDLSEKLRWPCEPDEALSVIMAMDDTWVEIEGSKRKG
ncbi:hypothetical protein SAMN04487952_1233 [Halomonas caseinilytica]|nr:hypothetical protein SAMN04487952_1233 [Halomonas caseinilytica]